MMARKVMAGAGDPGVLSPNHASRIVQYDMGDTVSGPTIVDLSPNGNDGTNTGATIVAGSIGNALNFSAVNAKVATPIFSDPSGSFSFHHKHSSATFSRVYTQGRTSTIVDWGSVTVLSDGTLVLFITISSVTNQFDSVLKGSTSGFSRYIVSHDAGVTSMFIDGVSSTVTHTGLDSTVWFDDLPGINTSNIGVLERTSTLDGGGIIDQFRYDNRAFSQSDADALNSET